MEEKWELRLSAFGGRTTLHLQFQDEIFFNSDGTMKSVPYALQRKYNALTSEEIKEKFGILNVLDGCKISSRGQIQCYARKSTIFCQMESIKNWILSGSDACRFAQKKRTEGMAERYILKDDEFVPIEK